MRKPNRAARVGLSVVIVMLLLAACVPAPQMEEVAGAGVNVRTEKALLVSNYITDQGTLTVAGATTLAGDLALNGAVTIGDGGDTVAVNSSDWDISTTGAMTGIGAVTTDGLATLALGATISGATTSINADSNFGTNINTGSSTGALALGGGFGTVAVNSSDWDIDATGIMTGIGAITADGLVTAQLGATISGATTSINASSNFGTNINTGSSTGALALGGGFGTVAVDSSDWDIDATGNASGLGTIGADGLASLDGGIAVDTANFTVDGATGAVSTASTLAVTGASTLTGAVTVADDVTVSADSTGGNAGAINQFIGVPRISMVGLGLMPDGTSNTVLTDIGDSETPATDWTGVTAGTSITVTNDIVRYRQGTASLKIEIGTDAVAGEGITNTLASGDQDWTDDEAFGFWLYTDKALASGDLVLRIWDVTAADYTDVNIPAATALSWQWLETNVTLGNNNLKDVITDLSIVLSAAGEAKALAGAFQVNLDFIVKWDVADEQALGLDILQDGVMSVMAIDMTNGAATTTNLTQYTNYFVHYQASGDAIVPISDLDDADLIGIALVAY